MQRDTCHFWFDRRDFNMILDLAGKLWQAANITTAMLAVAGLQIEFGRWVLMKRAMGARVRLLLCLRGCLVRCLAALARGRAGLSGDFGSRLSFSSSSPTRARSAAFSAPNFFNRAVSSATCTNSRAMIASLPVGLIEADGF